MFCSRKHFPAGTFDVPGFRMTSPIHINYEPNEYVLLLTGKAVSVFSIRKSKANSSLAAKDAPFHCKMMFAQICGYEMIQSCLPAHCPLVAICKMVQKFALHMV